MKPAPSVKCFLPRVNTSGYNSPPPPRDISPSLAFLVFNSWLALSRNKKIENHSVEKVVLLKGLIKNTLLEVLSLCVFLNFGYLTKYFEQIHRAQYGAAMSEFLRGTPTWRPENSVNIWNLLCLSRRLIICTEQTSFYISTFPNTVFFTG